MFFYDLLLVLILIFMVLFMLTMAMALLLRVPFVPSNNKALQSLLQLDWQDKKRVCDLGSGNGKILFFLRRKFPHLELAGYELAPLPYLWAVIKNKLLGANIRFHYRNFFHADLDQYDVLFCYLMPNILQKIGHKLRSSPKEQLLITNVFSLQDFPQEREIKNKHGERQLLVYRV